eukprot:2961974-Pyramimonas_sp.AAC.1
MSRNLTSTKRHKITPVSRTWTVFESKLCRLGSIWKQMSKERKETRVGRTRKAERERERATF